MLFRSPQSDPQLSVSSRITNSDCSLTRFQLNKLLRAYLRKARASDRIETSSLFIDVLRLDSLRVTLKSVTLIFAPLVVILSVQQHSPYCSARSPSRNTIALQLLAASGRMYFVP